MDSTVADSVGLFLAHALALETDAARQYADLATSVAARNHPEIETLFRDLAYQSRKHAAEVAATGDRMGGLPTLPAIAVDSPEGIGSKTVADVESAEHALRIALACEHAAKAYYASVAVDTSDPEVARLASEFADEEDSHVRLVNEWLARLQAPSGIAG